MCAGSTRVPSAHGNTTLRSENKESSALGTLIERLKAIEPEGPAPPAFSARRSGLSCPVNRILLYCTVY